MTSSKKAAPKPAATPTPQKVITDPAPITKADLKTEDQLTKQQAIQGTETADQIAAREAQTIKNPRKARPRGQRALISDSSLGLGAIYGSTNLG